MRKDKRKTTDSFIRGTYNAIEENRARLVPITLPKLKFMEMDVSEDIVDATEHRPKRATQCACNPGCLSCAPSCGRG